MIERRPATNGLYLITIHQPDPPEIQGEVTQCVYMDRGQKDLWEGVAVSRGIVHSQPLKLSYSKVGSAVFWLECPFSFKVVAKAVHQISAECPTLRLLRIRIGKMSANFLETLFRLLIPLQPLGSL